MALPRHSHTTSAAESGPIVTQHLPTVRATAKDGTKPRFSGEEAPQRLCAQRTRPPGKWKPRPSERDRLLADDEDTTLVIGAWAYQGTGWTQPGDEALALAAAARAREYEQWRASKRQAR